MKVEHELLDACEAKLTIEVDAEQIDQAKRKAARQLAQRYPIPGFRKGKAPYEIILRHFGDAAVFESALDDLAQLVYQQALDEAKLEPVGPGQMVEAKLDPPLFTFTVPLRPIIELGEYRKVRLGYTEPTVTEEALNDYLEHLRSHEAVLEPVEREAQLDDVITIDVVGKLIWPADSESAATPEPEAAPAPEAEAAAPPEAAVAELEAAPTEEFLLDDKDVEILLDSKLDWPAPGFAEKVIGIQTDEERQVELAFPDDYANESLRGKPARFVVKCKGVKSRTLPEWDDEFARSLGDYESLEDLRDKSRERLLTQVKRQTDKDYTTSVIDIVVAGAGVKYPQYLFDREVDELRDDLDRRLREQNLTLADYQRIMQRTDEQLREELEPNARERLRRGLVLNKVMEAEGLKVDPTDVIQRIDLLAGLLGKEANKYRKMMNTASGRRSVEYDMLTEQAIARLVAIAKGENPPLPGSLEVLSEANEPGADPVPATEAPNEPAAIAEAAPVVDPALATETPDESAAA